MQRRAKRTDAAAAMRKNHYNSSSGTTLQVVPDEDDHSVRNASSTATNIISSDPPPRVVMRGALQLIFSQHQHENIIPHFIPYNKSLQNFTASVTSRRRRRRQQGQPQTIPPNSNSVDEESALLTTSNSQEPVMTPQHHPILGMAPQTISFYHFLVHRQVLVVFAVGEDFWSRPDSYSVKLYRRLMQAVAHDAADTPDATKDDRRAAVVLLVPPSILQRLTTTSMRNDHPQMQLSSSRPSNTTTHDGLLLVDLLPPWLQGAGVAIMSNTFLIRTACGLTPHSPSLAVIDLQQQHHEQQKQNIVPLSSDASHEQHPHSILVLIKGHRLSLTSHEELALEWNAPSFCAKCWIEDKQSALTCSQKAISCILFPSLGGDMCTIL